MEIGAQIFTIREYCKDLQSFSESLKKIADIGYNNIQVSGTCDFEPEWLADQLKANDLKCVLTHTPAAKLINNPAKVAAEHDVFGCEYIGLGYFGFDEEKENQKYEDFIATYKPVAKALKEHGKYFMYHNHDHEFKKYGKKLIIELLSEMFDAKEMGFTLDTFWIQVGGGDPAFWIEKLKNRVPCIHIKDYSYGREMAVIGEGNINFDRVFEKAESSGTKFMLVEQDDCHGEDPFNCLKRSFEYLHSLGLE